MVTNVRTYETTSTDRGIADPNYVEGHGHTHGHRGAVHVHWGSVFAGIFVALSVMALLSALGAAIGATAYDPGEDTRRWGIGTGIWALVSALISFIVGGFVAARTSGHTDRQNGLFHGFMVWAVTIPLLAFLVGSGLNRLATGAVSNSMTPNVARSMNAPDVTADDAKKAAMGAAWGALASLLLGMGAASLGGHLGARGLPRAQDLKPTTTTTA